MSNKNITSIIKKLHEEKISQEILDEVEADFITGIPPSLLDELKTLRIQAEQSNIISFPQKKHSLAQTNLMAAAGQNLGNWFDQPIVFVASGLILDIRRVIGTNNEVDVFIQSNTQDTSLIERNLLPFGDKTLQIKLSINGKELLEASIYVDEQGVAAEGSGYLKSLNESNMHGNVDLDIIIDDD